MQRTSRRFGLIVLLLVFCSQQPAIAETLQLSDDFSIGLATNWNVGTNSLYNPGGPTVAIDNEILTYTQEYDFVETKETFSGDVVRVEVDLARVEGSLQCLDFVIEFTGLPNLAGIVRLTYGLQLYDTINIGIAPKTTGNSTTWDCIYEASYGIEIASAPPHEGTATLTYDHGNVTMSWTNDLGVTITSPVASTGVTLTETTVRIWGVGGDGSARYLDNVKIYSGGDCDCADTDSDGVPDAWDLCAGTPVGLYVDPTGCDVNNDSQAGLEDAILIMRTLTGL